MVDSTSPDWKRGYQLGYNRGGRNVTARQETLHQMITDMRERAERAEAGLGLGMCSECAHWQRHEPVGAQKYRWGWCLLTEAIETDNWPWRGDPDQKIATKENFGCVRFRRIGQVPSLTLTP